jgi:hypothetical protein
MHHPPSDPRANHPNVETVTPPEPGRIGRRAATGALIGLGLTALAGAAFAAQALPRTWRKLAEDLARHANELSRALAAGRLSPIGWQDAMAGLLRGVDSEDLVRSIDLDTLLAHAPGDTRGAAVLPLELFPEGAPPEPGFCTRLIALGRGRANPPHAHDNMASAHYVLRGSFRARHFDRVRDEPEHIVLRPTVDRSLRAGEATSISDQRDNVHWHLAETDGVLLDISHERLIATAPSRTHFVDPTRADALDDGLLRAPRVLSVEEAVARFGG